MACFKRGYEVAFKKRSRALGEKTDPTKRVRGPYTFSEGKTSCHGDANNCFTCYPDEPPGEHKKLTVRYFDWRYCCFGHPGSFCDNYEHVRSEGPGAATYRCLGHDDHNSEWLETPAAVRSLIEEERAEERRRASEGATGHVELPPGPEVVGGPSVRDDQVATRLPPGTEEVTQGETDVVKRGERLGRLALDYWEPVPAHHAWVRHHVYERRALFRSSC